MAPRERSGVDSDSAEKAFAVESDEALESRRRFPRNPFLAIRASRAVRRWVTQSRQPNRRGPPMSFAAALKQEITRLARKEIKANTDSTRRAVAQFRRDIAELKRGVKAMEGRLAALEREEKKRVGQPAASSDLAEGARFAPRWVRSHRERIGFSQADYATLVGVSPMTIYNWEHGKTKPGKEQLAALVAVRRLGKREAERRWEMLD